MSDTEIAWVAGLLEGEGSFQLNRRKTGTARDTTTVRCSMTDYDVVKRLAETIDGGTVNPDGYDNNHRREPTTDYKQIYSWQMSRGKDVYDFLGLIRPYMGERRTVKIDEMRSYYEDNPLKYARTRGAVVHGTRNGYENYGCRCESCRETSRKHNRETVAHKKAAKTALAESSKH